MAIADDELTLAIGQYTIPSAGTYIAGCVAFADSTRIQRRAVASSFAPCPRSSPTRKGSSDGTVKEPFPVVLVPIFISDGDPRKPNIKEDTARMQMAFTNKPATIALRFTRSDGDVVGDGVVVSALVEPPSGFGCTWVIEAVVVVSPPTRSEALRGDGNNRGGLRKSVFHEGTQAMM